MLKTRILCFLLALGCAFAVMQAASAAEVDSGRIYCFSREDFPEELVGICITDLPDRSAGTVYLGERVLRPGDILTAEQTAQMTFCPVRTEEDTAASVTYLPIYRDRVAESTTMTIAIRGREDLPPAAEDFALETYKNLPIEGRLKVSDPEEQSMTYAVVRQPRRGSVTIGEDGSFTYTPKKNKVGVDSFTYTATDAAGKVSREATVTVTILKTTAAPYSDTAGRDCRFAAEWMKNTGIFTGETLAENSCFSPDKAVTRGEFLTMLVKTLRIPTQEELTVTGYTGEVPSWLQPYLAAAVRSGLTAGLPDTQNFDHSSPITGAEAAVMLQNALDLTAPEDAAEDPAQPAWAADALTALAAFGIAPEAESPLTREDAAVILYETFLLSGDAPGMRVIRMQQ